MHFSSMAVSILAQSLPLLALGHLDGWKTREERSWLQRQRRLRDARMLFEKRVEVHDKLDNVLGKRHAGSARLLQDSSLSKAPSDDREASVECDPLSKVSDSGIFGCGMDSHCVESENSELGGLCVASKQAPSISRALQADLPICVAGPDGSGYTCDCSQFYSTTGVGIFTCTGPSVNTSYTYNADGSYIIENCNDYSGSTDSPVETYCVSLISNLDSPECAIKINDVTCNSCEFEVLTCPATVSEGEECCRIRDCTNTIADYDGNSCDDETTVPIMTDAPNASPSETPPPATSSGSSHAAKVTIVVSAAAAVWMASFGT